MGAVSDGGKPLDERPKCLDQMGFGRSEAEKQLPRCWGREAIAQDMEEQSRDHKTEMKKGRTRL